MNKENIDNIASELAKKVNAKLEEFKKNGSDIYCNAIEVKTIGRLQCGSETGDIARKLMKIMFPDSKKNQGLISVDYDPIMLLVKLKVDYTKI